MAGLVWRNHTTTMRRSFVIFDLVILQSILHGAEPISSLFKIRGTLPWHNFLSGPTAWDEEDYAKYLDHLQALGLNYVVFHCYTGGAERYAPYVEPIIRIQYRDVLPLGGFDTSLTARWGYRPLALAAFPFGTSKLFPLRGGTEAFGAKYAVLARTNVERYEMAQGLMKRVVEMAHARGIQVGMGFEFGIHPPEFASVVPSQSSIRGANLPDPTHPASIEILRSTIDDILRAYPGIDWIWLWLHEHTMHVGTPFVGPAFRLKDRWFAGLLKAKSLPAEAGAARESLKAAPMKKLFATFARRVRSKGELGELSALNQKLWLAYRELDRFLAEAGK